MKRFFAFLICFILVFSIIPFSAFAQESAQSDYVITAGTYAFVGNITPFNQEPIPLEFESNNNKYYGIFAYNFGEGVCVDYYGEGFSSYYNVYKGSNGWTEPYRKITVTYDQVVLEHHYNWFIANTSKLGDKTGVYGLWQFLDTLSASDLSDGYYLIDGRATATISGDALDISGFGVHISSGNVSIKAYIYNSTDELEVAVANHWLYGTPLIEFHDDVFLDEPIFNWLMANAYYLDEFPCDGSSCSVADYDLDNICDTCGAPLAFSVQRTFVPDPYPSYLPYLPVGVDERSLYVIYINESFETEMYLFTPYNDAVVEWNTIGNEYGSLKVDAGTPVQVYRYKIGSSGDWYQVSSTSSSSTIFGSWQGDLTIIYSSHNLYTADGTLFFPLPLWETVEKVTQGEMGILTEKISSTVLILVVSAVSLLALVVCLSLFGKRSLLYLKR